MKPKLFVLLFIVSLVISFMNISSAAGTLKVQMYNSSTAAATNTINPVIRLTNQSSSAITLSTVTIRYYYTIDGEKAQSYWCDYAVMNPGNIVETSNITGKFVKPGAAVTGADYYLELGFTSAAGTLAAGAAVDIQSRFAKTDWTNYMQTGDYSFNSSATSLVDWNNVTAYVSGTLCWGNEPGGGTPVPTATPVPGTPASTPTPTRTATPTPAKTATPTPSSSSDYIPQGYGAVATGGSSVYHVTTLSDSGTGSLRDALSASGRRVVFDIAGTITITSTLVIPSNTTIDGTTAPGPGITVTGYNTSMSGRNNIIIRNIRFREDTTGPEGKCSLQGADACYNILIDHCSIEWGRWDCLSFTNNSHDITIQYCIIGQGIDPQYFGCLIDACDRISIHHNLFIGNNNRNPKLKGNCQYINNVVYNWGSAGGLQGGHSSAPWKSDIINNYFIKGLSSANNSWAFDCTSNDQWYQSGNYKDLDRDGVLDGSLIAVSDFNALTVTLLSSLQHSPSAAVLIDSTSAAVNQAAAGAYGCQPNDYYDNILTGYLRSYGTQGKIGK